MPIDYTTKCPYCGETCECDLCDVGVGYVQCGPYYCENCGASEIHPDDKREQTAREKATGWYEPGTAVSENANTVGGVLISVDMAMSLNRMGISLDPKPDFFD